MGLVYELRGKTSDGLWLIVGLDPKKPKAKPVVSIYYTDTMNILSVLEGLNGEHWHVGCVS